MYVAGLTKNGYMKYISHLDMVRLFRNAFNIAGLKLIYSKGFNPHPRLSFAQPLSLGYSSACEMLEFETQDSLDPVQIMDALNTILPEGLRVISCETVEEGKNLAARVAGASYEIHMPAEQSTTRLILKSLDIFLEQEKIVVQKIQKKSGEKKEIDIKGMIRSIAAETVEDGVVIYADVDAGSSSNLSPELLISALLAFTGIDMCREEIDVRRTGLFFGSGV